MMLEYCGGGAVDGIMIELEKPLNEPQIAYITKYVCRALEYLHSCMVIHRDLKAGNILLTSDGTVKLGMLWAENNRPARFCFSGLWSVSADEGRRAEPQLVRRHALLVNILDYRRTLEFL